MLNLEVFTAYVVLFYLRLIGPWTKQRHLGFLVKQFLFAQVFSKGALISARNLSCYIVELAVEN